MRSSRPEYGYQTSITYSSYHCATATATATAKNELVALEHTAYLGPGYIEESQFNFWNNLRGLELINLTCINDFLVLLVYRCKVNRLVPVRFIDVCGMRLIQLSQGPSLFHTS